MIKICYVVTIPITIKSFFVPQLKYLSDNGYDVTVVCGYDKDLGKILGEKIKYKAIDIPRGISIVDSIQAIIGLKNFFMKSSFNIVQYSTPNASLYASIASRRANIPIRIYHLMGYKYQGTTGILKIILKSFERISCRLSTSVECVSNSTLKLGIEENFFNKNMATVVGAGSTGGVDLNKFNIHQKAEWRKVNRERMGLLNSDIVLGFCGRVTKDKGIDELFEAYLKVRVYSNIKMLIVGDFEDEKSLNQELLRTIRYDDNVIFQPRTQEVEKYFAMMDVLILPSYREGFGNVIIEAAAMGIPTLASNIPGPSDVIINNCTGLLHEVKNSKDIEMKLNLLVSSINLINEYGLNAYKNVIKHFSSEIINKAILKQKNLYLNID